MRISSPSRTQRAYGSTSLGSTRYNEPDSAGLRGAKEAYGPEEESGDVPIELVIGKDEVLAKHRTRWVDEEVIHDEAISLAKRLANHKVLQALVITVTILDVASTIFSVVKDDASETEVYDTVLGVTVITVLSFELAARLLAYQLAFFKKPFNYFDFTIVVITVMDLALSLNMPTAALRLFRLLRPLVMMLSNYDAMADLAVDRLLSLTLGDVLHVTGTNTTCSVAKGFLIIEKTHLLPKVCKDIHGPFQILGGYCEQMYFDLNQHSGQNVSARYLSEFTEPMGKTLSADTESDDLEAQLRSKRPLQATRSDGPRQEGLMLIKNLVLVVTKSSLPDPADLDPSIYKKDKLIELVARRIEAQVAKRHRRRKRVPRTALAKLKDILTGSFLDSVVDLSNIAVDIRNIEIRYEDPTMTFGMRLGNLHFRTAVGYESSLKHENFRAQSIWDYESQAMDRALSENPTLVPDTDPPLRLAIRCHRLAAWCDHEGDPDWRRRVQYTPFFQSTPPAVSQAVATMRKERYKEMAKVAAVSVLAQSRFLKEGATAGLEAVDRLWEKVQLHQYLLKPLTASLHATSTLEENTPSIGAPAQVIDLRLPWVSLQADRAQVRCLRKLERDVRDWLEMDRMCWRLPTQSLAGLTGASPQERRQVCRNWWDYAGLMIADGIQTGGNLSRLIDVRRMAHSRAQYSQMMLERHVATAPLGQRIRNALNGITVSSLRDKGCLEPSWSCSAAASFKPATRGRISQLQRVQFTLPMQDILAVRRQAKRRYLDLIEGPGEPPASLMRYGNSDSSASAENLRQHQSPRRSGRKHQEDSPTSVVSGMIDNTGWACGRLRACCRKPAPADASAKTQFIGGLRKSMSRTLSMSKSKLVGCQLRLRILRLKVALLEPLDIAWPRPSDLSSSSSAAPAVPDERALVVDLDALPLGHGEVRDTGRRQPMRKPIVNAQWQNIRAGASRSAPVEAWEHMKSVVTCWEDLVKPDAPGEAAEEPVMENGEAVPGWWFAHCAAGSVSVTAPGHRPMLRNIVRMRRPSSLAPSWSSQAMSLWAVRWRRRTAPKTFNELEVEGDGEPTFARPHVLPPENRGVAALNVCAMDLVEYHPLYLEVKQIISKEPPRPPDDPFVLADIGARLEQWRDARNRIKRTVRRFERVCRVNAVNTVRNRGTLWSFLTSTEGLNVTVVRPFTKRTLLIGQASMPKWRECWTRSTGPPEVGCGLSLCDIDWIWDPQFDEHKERPSQKPGEMEFLPWEPTLQREETPMPTGLIGRLCLRSFQEPHADEAVALDPESVVMEANHRRLSAIFEPASRRGFADTMQMEFKVIPIKGLAPELELTPPPLLSI